MKSKFLVTALFLLSVFAYAELPQITPFTADLQITSASPEASVREITGKVYAGDGHVRMNMEAGGHSTALITNFASRTTDVLLIDQKMYIEHKVDALHNPEMMSDNLKPYDPANPCANEPNVSCKKIGVEEVSDRTCDHWEVTDKQRRVTNLWIDQQLHLPIKVVTKEATMLLTNVKEGEPDAGLFTIPDGFHKIELGGRPNPSSTAPPHN